MSCTRPTNPNPNPNPNPNQVRVIGELHTPEEGLTVVTLCPRLCDDGEVLTLTLTRTRTRTRTQTPT